MTNASKSWRTTLAAAAFGFICLISGCAEDQAKAPLTAQTSSAKPIADGVMISAGRLSGIDLADGIHTFKGIPYAAAPVGDLRWRRPAPAPSWSSTREATEFGAACPQGMGFARMMGVNALERSEDCLFLNVWTPAETDAEKLPVMVWIHGGGLSVGWGHQSLYDGTELAKRGVVLVSINYRLGPLGFLAHPGLSGEDAGRSGNYGFLDQLAALEWVKENIGAFGGDRDRVTIFGESAGGTSVYALLASPLTKGLAHRAIAQSPWITESNVAALTTAGRFAPSAETLGRQWASEVAPDANIAAIRAMAVDDIIGDDKPTLPMYATVDGHFLKQAPEAVFAAGKQLDIPVIVGTNRDEGTMFTGFGFSTAEQFEGALGRTWGQDAGVVAELYPLSDGVPMAANRYITDTWFLRASRVALEGARIVKSPAWQYHFTRVNPANPAMGASHGAEIGYAFNTGRGLAGADQGDGDAADQQLSAAMIGYWAQFATSGDPNTDGLPNWPEYDANRTYLELGDTISPGKSLGADRLDLLDKLVSATAK